MKVNLSWDKATQVTKKYLIKPLIWLVLGLLCVFSLLVMAIRMPIVQNWAVAEITTYLSAITKHEVKVGHVDISWLDQLLLEEVVIFDRQKNEMIKVASLRADFDLTSLISSKEPAISEVWLDGPDVSTIIFKDNDQLNINELVDAFAQLSSKSDTSVASQHVIFHVDKVHLSNGRYTHYDQRKDSIRETFDYYHFTLKGIHGEVDQLRIAGDTFEINVQGLVCEDVKTKLRSKRLDTFYRYCSKSMQFHRLYAEIGESVVKDYLEFNYNNNKELTEFNDFVVIKAHLDSSIIYSSDLSHFASTLKNLNDRYTISSDVKGKVVDLAFNNLILRYGKKSEMRGKIAFRGFPEIDETFVNAKFTRFATNAHDMDKYIGRQAADAMAKFGHVNYKGSYVGFFADFVAKGRFVTDLGSLDSDINIKIKEDEGHSEYQGKIKTSNFQLGKLMDKTDLLGTIEMDGRIQGVGFSYSHAHFKLDANVHRIDINQYQYRHVKVAANLMKSTFQGSIVSADSNARFTLDGLLDFNQTPHFLDFTANVGFVNLKNLRILDEPITFSTKATLNIHGTNWDDFQGDASFAHTFLSNASKTLSLDTIKLITEKVDNERYVNFISDLLEVNADGSFSYATLMKDLPRLYREYLLAIENKETKIKEYYSAAAPYDSGDYRLNFSFLLKKTNPIINLFTQNLRIADNTRVNGTFSKLGQKTSLNVVGMSSKIEVGDVQFIQNRLNYTSTKNLRHPFVDGSGIFYSQKQKFTNDLKSENLNVDMVWNNDNVLFGGSIEQKKRDNHLKTNGRVILKEGRKDLFVDNLDLKLLQTQWRGDSSFVSISEDEIDVKHFILRSGEQRFLAQGQISADPEDDLHLEISNFLIKPFGTLFEKDLEGEIDGDVVFSNLMSKNLKLDFDGGIQQLKVNNFLIGNILGQTDWRQEKEQFDVDFTLSRDSVKNLTIKGYVKPFENNRWSLTARLDKFDLQTLEPFTEDIMSHLEGGCSGDLDIKGTMLHPDVTGKIHVQDGKFRLNFLNTSYMFTDDVTFDTSQIRVDEMALVDTNGNSCYVTGMVKHNRFRDFTFDLNGRFKELLVLNTEEKDNSLFYGKAYATGRVKLTGPIDEIKVYVNAKNDEDSRIFIPVRSTENLGGSDFITYVTKQKEKKDPEDEDGFENKVEPFVLSVKMDLDLNPDMEFDLVLDPQTGDVIKGTGSGSLKMNASTNGDFDLFGTYTFLNGRYNFTLLNLVNKKFDIKQGSTINWNGDPFAGQLDIKAEIEEKASLKDILPETDTAWFNHPAIRKRYPAIVNLYLKGNLMNPEISYKILVKDYPLSIADSKLGSYPLDNYVRAFLQQLDVNEQQLNRQVFSLLVLRKFFPLNSATSGGLAGQGAAGTISSLLSSQLSTWISQVDENLTIDIDLNGFSSQALNDLRLRLTYTPDILNNRIRITRDGSFTNNQNKSTVSSIAGDWSLEYLITQNGTLRLKMFTRNNYNNIASSLNNANQTSTGFSLMHTQSFDNLAELIKRKKSKEDVADGKFYGLLEEKQRTEHPDSTQTKKTEAILPDRLKKAHP